MNDDLNTLISVLESPVFQSILNIQDSLKELKKQVSQAPSSSRMVTTSPLLHPLPPPQVHLHPSILPEDFDITPGGQLILNLPPGGEEAEPYQVTCRLHLFSSYVNFVSFISNAPQNGYLGESEEQTGESEREGEPGELGEPETGEAPRPISNPCNLGIK